MVCEMELSSNENKLKFENVKQFILSGLAINDVNLKDAAEKFNSNDEIVKTAVEHSFRIYVLQNLTIMSIPDMKKVLEISVQAAQKKLCLPTTPIFLINDMLSVLTIEKCSEIFCYLEDSSNIWKSELFYASVKNYLLRMCNDLLKRLSKSQNTVFSGRIHLFLAKLFPLNEKSGLNLMSHFSDNFTRYTTSVDAFEEAINKNKSVMMEVDDTDDKSSIHLMPIDYNLYTKFWSLQEFFNKPNSCYDKTAWKNFTTNANEVFEALKSYRLEDIKDDTNTGSIDGFDDMDLYFSKYLTSEKLLDLQLNDTNFRRQILIQFLILFQYLTSEIKFKNSNQTLNEEQQNWLKSSMKKVNELIKETPPLGNKFLNNVKNILDREEIWNKWKNEGCPNFVKEKKLPVITPAKTATKRPKPNTSDFIVNYPNKVLVIDNNTEIGKLCNVDHDNLEACKDPKRQFLPSLKEFFEECIDQLDPANQVEKQYRLVYQTDWAWKALRLLAKRSAFYFMQNQNVKTIPEYLEAVCSKLTKEFNANEQTQSSNQLNNKAFENGSSHEANDEDSNKNSPGTPLGNQDNLNQDSNDKNELIDNENENLQHENNDEETVHLNDDMQANTSVMDRNEENENTIENESQTNNNYDTHVETIMAIDSKNEENSEIASSLSKQVEYKKFFDTDLIDYLADNIIDINELKEIANSLKIDSEKLANIQNQTNELKQQARKVLQLWTEEDERNDLPSIFLNILKDLGKQSFADKFELKLK